MMRHPLLLAGFGLFLLSISWKISWATDASILQAENSVSAGTGLLRLQYGETFSGFPGYLDTETGNINTMIFEWSSLADDREQETRTRILGIRMFPGAYVSGKVIYSYGTTDYDGHTLSGTPASTADLMTFVKGSIAFGKSFKSSDRLVLIPALIGGITFWKRVSNPNAILNGVYYETSEIYRHLSAGVGLKGDYRIVDGEVFSLGIDLLQNINSGMTSSFDGNHYDLGNTMTMRINGKFTYEPAQRVNLYGEINYETFNYGQSAVAPNGFFEPDSKTALTLYSVGVAYAF